MKNKLLVFSLFTLTLSHTGFADKLSDETLDLLSAEAGETDMSKTAPVASSQDEPDPKLEPSEPVDHDALSDSITKQLSTILGGGNETADNEEEIAAKLENVVSSALLEGVNMDDLRSAVSLAMDDLKTSAEAEGTAAIVEQASETLDTLVGEAKQEDAVEEAEEIAKAQQQEEKALEAAVLSTIAPTPVVASPVAKTASESSLPETVTVLVGESLYKVALRVYGRGDDYLRLYEANKESIIDPNIVLVGQVLRVPK